MARMPQAKGVLWHASSRIQGIEVFYILAENEFSRQILHQHVVGNLDNYIANGSLARVVSVIKE